MLPQTTLDLTLITQARDILLRDIFGRAVAREQRTPGTTRMTYEFGHRYARMADGDFSVTAMPGILQDLRGHAVRQFAQSGIVLPPASRFTNCIVSEYKPGFRLEPHVDVHKDRLRTEGKDIAFYFGEDVINVIIEADTTGRLYFVQKHEPPAGATFTPVATLEEQDGTTFLLTGAWRREPFYHGVTPVENRRISATYRTVHFT